MNMEKIFFVALLAMVLVFGLYIINDKSASDPEVTLLCVSDQCVIAAESFASGSEVYIKGSAGSIGVVKDAKLIYKLFGRK